MPSQSQEAPVGTLSHVCGLSLALCRAPIDPLRPRCEGPLWVCGRKAPPILSGAPRPPCGPLWDTMRSLLEVGPCITAFNPTMPHCQKGVIGFEVCELVGLLKNMSFFSLLISFSSSSLAFHLYCFFSLRGNDKNERKGKNKGAGLLRRNRQWFALFALLCSRLEKILYVMKETC